MLQDLETISKDFEAILQVNLNYASWPSSNPRWKQARICLREKRESEREKKRAVHSLCKGAGALTIHCCTHSCVVCYKSSSIARFRTHSVSLSVALVSRERAKLSWRPFYVTRPLFYWSSSCRSSFFLSCSKWHASLKQRLWIPTTTTTTTRTQIFLEFDSVQKLKISNSSVLSSRCIEVTVMSWFPRPPGRNGGNDLVLGRNHSNLIR